MQVEDNGEWTKLDKFGSEAGNEGLYKKTHR